jgi:DNA helicase-2/ATP-dependent DNA helicase PcrA
VAITRSRKILYITRASSRLMWGKRNYAIRSRFIAEIPDNVIQSDNLSNNLLKFNNYESDDSNKNSDNILKSKYLDLEFKIGDVVKHNKFGNGKIIDIVFENNRIIGDIFFIGIGKKTLDFKIAKIEKV